MSEIPKPVPRRDGLHDQFYEFVNQRELRFQRCANCDTWRHMPRESCEHCGSFDWKWQASSGKATLFTWTTIHRALHPAFADDVPYTSVVVEMEEGVRLVSKLEDVPDDELAVGLPLLVEFAKATPEVTLHQFRKRND